MSSFSCLFFASYISWSCYLVHLVFLTEYWRAYIKMSRCFAGYPPQSIPLILWQTTRVGLSLCLLQSRAALTWGMVSAFITVVFLRFIFLPSPWPSSGPSWEPVWFLGPSSLTYPQFKSSSPRDHGKFSATFCLSS